LAYKAFTVVFYGSKIFDRKTAQLSETLRESGYLVSTLKQTVQHGENRRKISVLNYKPAALRTELCRDLRGWSRGGSRSES
jgi:hypothetical protein